MGKEPETEVEQILDEVGDEDLVICDNIERALYLSLKYEFVTPLTSLVVVSPDQADKEGKLSELGQHNRRHVTPAIHFGSTAPANYNTKAALGLFITSLLLTIQ